MVLGSTDGPLWDPGAVPAATVVVLRDGPDGPEVLLLRRDSRLRFAGGSWVFPGGRIDPVDRTDPPGRSGPDDRTADELLEAAARRAAVREAAEEAGVSLDETRLLRWSHWTPPPREDRRFSTAFFCAALDDAGATITVDDGEIREHRWVRPSVALELRDSGELSLTPPTYITLVQLAAHPSVDAALEWARTTPSEHFATRIAVQGDRWIALYHGDVAYTADDPSAEVDRPGPRHRLTMGPTWTYERSDRGTT